MIRFGTFRFGVLLALLATLVLQAGLTAAASAQVETDRAAPPAQSGQSTSGVWTTAGNIIDGREQHTATLLADGQVLVAGSCSLACAIANAELYDPATRTWVATGSMINARNSHTATRLSNGRVLVAGGGGPLTASAEIYDPASGTWAATGSLTVARLGHTATLLNDGRVLVAGGNGGSGRISSAEIYDPASGTWAATGSLTVARLGHTATLLNDGRVLVAGGFVGVNTGTITNRAEIYDPVSGTWS